MFSQVFDAMSSIVGYGIYFEKKSFYSLLAVSAGAVLNLGLNFILIPRYGISAAALTTLLGYALNYFLTLYFSEKLYPCEYGQRKMMISIVLLYVACFAGAEAGTLLKTLIWLVCLVGMLFSYRNMLKTVGGYFMNALMRKHC